MNPLSALSASSPSRDGAAECEDVPRNAVGNEPRKFVRVIERHANGLVQFEFAVGWPDLACELALPMAAFDAFCEQHGVELLSQAAPDALNTLPGDSDDGQH
jgi:phenol/toluene 2-monooxygenase (NADH) P0/A0